MPDLPLQCSCGGVRGTVADVAPDRGNRLVCYCDDCQAFPHFLGCADSVLDRHAGTEIFQTSPARVRFNAGTEQLACLRLTQGGLHRWYAACCNTPIGNTRGAGMPFVGLVCACLADAATREAAMGPVRGGVQARFAKGEPEDAAAAFPLGIVLRFLRLMLVARLRGDQRRSPFFADGRPVAEPHVLSADKLASVTAAREAWTPGPP